MKTIWFVYPYGPLPSEKVLEVRYIRFSQVLSKMGFKCVWWTANFSHGLKEWRSESWKTIEVAENITIELVPTRAYKSNISLQRALFELKFASNLGKKIKDIEKPDIIMTSGTGLLTAFRPIWPYMQEKRVPVIYDIMDVHMIDSYMREHHKALSPFVKLVTNTVRKREKVFYDNVSAVTALGSGQLIIAKARTGNREIPSCLVYNGIYVDEFRQLLNQQCSLNLPKKKPEEIWCVYAGSLGPSCDIETVLKCAQTCRLTRENRIKFVFAGSGQFAEQIKQEAEDNPNVLYLGRLTPEQLIPVYRYCDIGLCTYASFSTVDMPDKFYDYCAAGLAIVNSLQGEVKMHITENNLGELYLAGDENDLLRAIKKLTDKNLLETCKTNAYNIGNRFDLKNQLIPLVNMINEIIQK